MAFALVMLFGSSMRVSTGIPDHHMKSPLLFQNQPAVEIADGERKALVSSEHGARLLRWEGAGREIITWAEHADWSKILKVRGCNPILFPFLARHFGDG